MKYDLKFVGAFCTLLILLQMKYSAQSQHFVKDHVGPRRKTIQAVAQNECNIIRL